MDTRVKKRVIIVGVILFFVFVIISLLYMWSQNQTNTSDTTEVPTTSYTDPYSGETVRVIEGVAPESYNNENPVIFLGFTKLLDLGMTQLQTDLIKSYIEVYSELRASEDTTRISEITLDYNTFEQAINSESGEKVVTIDTIINRDEAMRYQLIITSVDISNVIVVMTYNDSVVFNSSTDTPDH